MFDSSHVQESVSTRGWIARSIPAAYTTGGFTRSGSSRLALNARDVRIIRSTGRSS